ncbi:MAG: hypothetical protein KJ927_09360, partial [Candidatus Eisenbacteria bacterium]|nr:hypothetical protein [Candidatus Eisenbacteria bacterium]
MKTVKRLRGLIGFVPAFLLWGLGLSAQTAIADIFPISAYANFAEEGEFEAAIPSPSQGLGYPVGSRPATHREILDYFESLAGASPRAELIKYAETHEGRELIVLIVSSEKNIARLNEIQAAMARLSDPRGLSGAERERLLESTPAVCWMAYTIHGDEMSGSDAALALAYKLVAGKDSDAAMIREQAVVIIDPLQNPDGRDRFIAQMRSFNGKVPNPDTQSLGHESVYPWGRSNHYLFDLNRDWFTMVHPESRGRVKLMMKWHPQLVVDGHEMGAFDTYLFSPPRAPFNPYMTPELLKWWGRFAGDQAKALDRYGWSYYTREWNEEWFPGYGSSWAIYSGAVGILYEQAGTEGTVIKRPDGTVLEYGESVHHQYVSSMANLMTAALNRRGLLEDYVKERDGSLALGRDGRIKEFIFPPGPDPDRTRRLMEVLSTQGIEIEVASARFKSDDLFDPWGEAGSKEFPAGTYRISLSQPSARLAHVLLDFHLQMPDSFLVQERDYLERRKGSQLYEVTAWSLGHAYGVPIYWSGRRSSGSFKMVSSFPPVEGKFENGAADYGFVFDGESDAAILAAARLATEGFVVRVSMEPFRVQGHAYPRGSFLLRNDANPGDLAERLEALSKELGITIRGVSTALANGGPDLGGEQFRALVEPRIAMLSGDGVSAASMGSLWYLLDYEMNLRISLLKTSSFRDKDLSKYNVIILPSAWRGAGTYQRILGNSGVAKLRAWVEAGGTLIGIGAGAAFLADTSAVLSQVRQRRDVLKDYPIPDWGLGLAAAERMGRFQATGIEPQKPAAPVVEGAAPEPEPEPVIEGLGIPGPASPVLGAGAVPFAGEAGRNGAWTPPEAIAPTLSAEDWPPVDERLRLFHPQGA